MDISEEEYIMEEAIMREQNEIVLHDSDEDDELSVTERELSDNESELNTYDEFLENDLIDQIYNEDGDFLDADKYDGHYYIGLAGRALYIEKYILLSAISPKTFMKYNGDDIVDYLVTMSLAIWGGQPKIHILKLHITEDNTYTVIIKTFWLKIIQRKWKKIYKERCELLRKYKTLQYLRMREYTSTSQHFPGLLGMYHYGNLNTLVK